MIAKNLLIDIFKIAGKVGLLLQNKVVAEDALNDLMPGLFDVGMTLLNSCSKKIPESQLELIIKDLQNSINLTFTSLHILIQPHMQSKNSEKVIGLKDVLGSELYLRSLLVGAEQVETRVDVVESIGGLMESGSMKGNKKIVRERYDHIVFY